MANANILLNGMAPTPTLQDTFRGSMKTASELNDLQNQPLRNKLLQAQVASAETQNKATALGLDAETAKFQIGDAAKDAMMIKPMLAQDPARAVAALDARIQKITERGGDPSDTKYLRDGLASGQITPQQAIGELDNVISTAERFGVLQTTDTGLNEYRQQSIELQRQRLKQQEDMAAADRDLRVQLARSNAVDVPSNVKEYEYYKSLPPDEQKRYEAMKRGDRVTAGTEDKIYKTAVAAEESKQRAINYADLADRYEATDMGGGLFGSSLPEAVKELTGNQDAYTALRKDWTAIKASQVVSNLPPGAASDADVKLALGGFLPDNANAKQVASFMRGIAKMESIKADYESFKSDFMSENRSTVGLNNAWKVYAKQQKIGAPTISSANQEPVTKNNKLSAEDQAAIDWAKANPNDPRASKIMQLHGGR